MNLWKKISTIYKKYQLNDIELQFFNLFVNKLKNDKSKYDKKILIQCVEDPFYIY